MIDANKSLRGIAMDIEYSIFPKNLAQMWALVPTRPNGKIWPLCTTFLGKILYIGCQVDSSPLWEKIGKAGPSTSKSPEDPTTFTMFFLREYPETPLGSLQ